MARPRRNPDPTASMKRLIAVIERFCETHRMSESGFGRGFMKDSSFVGDLRRGRRVSLESVRKVKARIRVFAASSAVAARRSEEHTSELQSLMRISYAVFCLKKTKNTSI